jgi:site-specific recombinase XerD
MRLVFSTEDFVFAGRPRPGFPLVLDNDMKPAEPLHGYLLHRLLEKGKKLDIKTWEAYGRRLWDFAQFLNANNYEWNQPFVSTAHSVVRNYRDWQAEDLKLSPATINDRLEIVADLYNWALERRMIERLPFEYEDVTVRGIEHDFSHLTGGQRSFRRPDILVNEWEQEPAFLMADQLRLARASTRSTSHRIAFDLMARVGLRSIETCTFPEFYVFDPFTRTDIKPGSLIDVALDPRDMGIKFGRPRVVHVPFSLMAEMNTYKVFERNAFVRPERDRKELLLTTHGNRFAKESLCKVIGDLGRKVGFAIRPLMLRHSYAIHTLLLLREHPEMKIEPLMYVRDRLGHSSVQTTMVYLRQIERLLGAEALTMMNEFDALYGVTSAWSAGNRVLN